MEKSEKSLKEKATTALIWSFIDKFGQQILYFVTGVVLARKLSVDEYGLVGSLMFFTAVSTAIIGSGYGRALINQKSASQDELQSIFLYNLAVSAAFYVVLFFGAPLIAHFFHQPRLTELSRVLFLILPVNAAYIVQEIYLNIRMDLNKQAKANLFGLIPACLLATLAAMLGWGVWALVIQTLALAFFKMLFYWHYGKFRPGGTFRMEVLKRLLPFGSRVMFTNLINAVFSNIYSVLIGKCYTITQLGFYTQASKYQDIPSSLISNTFKAVSMSLLSQVNEEEERLRRILSKLIRTVSFFAFPLMGGMILIAKPLFVVLITERWLGSVPLFQILCLSGLFTIFNSVLQEAVLSKGRSKAVLYMEIVKKAVLVALILITLQKGVAGLAWGLATSSFIALGFAAILTHRYVRYSILSLLRDCAPYLGITGLLCGLTWFLTRPLENNILILACSVLGVGVLYLVACRLFRLEAMMEVEAMIRRKHPFRR
jgi:O-antigen/teichoic acid export membrane protein